MQTDRGGRRARAHGRMKGGEEEGLQRDSYGACVRPRHRGSSWGTTHIHNTMVVYNLKAGQRNDFACRLVSLDQMKSLLMLWVFFYIQITVQS